MKKGWKEGKGEKKINEGIWKIEININEKRKGGKKGKRKERKDGFRSRIGRIERIMKKNDGRKDLNLKRGKIWIEFKMRKKDIGKIRLDERGNIIEVKSEKEIGKKKNEIWKMEIDGEVGWKKMKKKRKRIEGCGDEGM